MGKRYRCEYCDKLMVSSPQIVKTHNKGLIHQTLVREHYQQYKDVETILAEELNKKPCKRHSQGNCKFGALCLFSHYTREQIKAMTAQVQSRNMHRPPGYQPSFQDLYDQLQREKTTQSQSQTDTTVIYDSSGLTHVLPWQYNDAFDSYGVNLPPSLKRMKVEDFEEATITEWG